MFGGLWQIRFRASRTILQPKICFSVSSDSVILNCQCVYTKSDASRSTAAQSSRLAFQSQIEFYDPVVSLNSVASPIGSPYWDTGGSRTTFGLFSRALTSTIILFARFASCYWTVFLFSEQLFFQSFLAQFLYRKGFYVRFWTC